ncbi:LytR family transcriptional regulator, partial [Bacillus inaquosorum]|nr:LytR family transcriptional regulator [Bacillus inaquosorum]
ETNIRITEGLALQQIYSGFTSKKIDTLSITGSDLYLGPSNTYYFEPDATNLEKVRQTLQEHLDYTPDTSSTDTSGTGSSTYGTGTEESTTDGTTSGSSYSNDNTSSNSTTNSTTDSSY